MSHLTPEGVVIARSGEVRLRTSNRMRPVFGKVLRDPRKPSQWLALNRLGLPIGRRTSTRAEAVVQLTEYTDEVVLSTVSVEDHVAVTTGPVEVVSDLRPERLKRALEVVGIVSGAVTGLAALSMLVAACFIS